MLQAIVPVGEEPHPIDFQDTRHPRVEASPQRRARRQRRHDSEQRRSSKGATDPRRVDRCHRQDSGFARPVRRGHYGAPLSGKGAPGDTGRRCAPYWAKSSAFCRAATRFERGYSGASSSDHRDAVELRIPAPPGHRFRTESSTHSRTVGRLPGRTRHPPGVLVRIQGSLAMVAAEVPWTRPARSWYPWCGDGRGVPLAGQEARGGRV